MKPLEALLLTVLGGFAAIFLLLSKNYNPTAALFPQLIAIASLLFLAAIIWGRRGNMGSDPSRADPSRDESDLASADLSQQRGSDPIFPLRPQIIGVQGAYIVLIYLIGFFAATLLYLWIAPLQLRYERRGIVLVHSVALTLVLAGSFLWLFNVQLPAGAIWDLW